MKLSLHFIFLLLFSFSVYSQNSEWINYTYNENIQSIVGKDDILWLATSGGLVKFNTITEEKEYFNVSNSDLNSNHVSPIALDSLGNVWMWKSWERADCYLNESTEDLVKFDGEEWTYYPLPIFNCQSFGLNPKLMEIDNNNNVWIGTGSSGLFKFDGNNWRLFDTTNSNIPTNSIADIAIDKENNKWIVSDELSGLIKFAHSTWSVFDSSNSGCPNEFYNNIEVDNTGKLWLSSFYNIVTFDGTSWNTFNNKIPNDTYIWNQTLKIDPNNEPWFLGNHLYHHSQNEWKIFPIEPVQRYFNPSALFIDNSNNKWMNSKRITPDNYEDYKKGGLAKFDSTGWSIYSLSNSKLKGYRIRTIFENSKNNLWLGADLLTEVNGTDWSIHTPKLTSEPIGSITSINEDSFGNMWFGSNGDGLFKFDGANWTTFDTDNSTIPNNKVFDIAFDNKGNIWFTTDWQLGLVKFDGNSFTVYDTTNSEIPTNYLHQIECDSQGNVWVGAVDKGLVKFDHNTWTLYSEQIKWNAISSLYIDGEDCVWIGGYGLTTFKEGIWSYYEHDDSIGYYLNSISHITKDKANNIWAIARYGLYKFDGNNWQKFDHTNSGLPDEFMGDLEFDQYGNLWIGTSSGVILYKESGVVTSIAESSHHNYIGNNYTLSQNYPNPFNPTTTIKYSVPKNVKRETKDGKAFIHLNVFDILGREIITLVNQKQKPGDYEVVWNATNQPSGIYFYQLKTDNYVETKKMVLLQ